MHVYKLQLVVTLLLNKGNIVRDKIMEVCQLWLQQFLTKCHFVKVINSIAQDTLNIIKSQRNQYNHALNYVDKDNMH